jgi:hypothetical protein
MAWALLALTLPTGVTLIAVTMRDIRRTMRRDLYRLVWPYARAYYTLRDEGDAPTGGRCG